MHIAHVPQISNRLIVMLRLYSPSMFRVAGFLLQTEVERGIVITRSGSKITATRG